MAIDKQLEKDLRDTLATAAEDEGFPASWGSTTAKILAAFDQGDLEALRQYTLQGKAYYPCNDFEDMYLRSRDRLKAVGKNLDR